MSIDFINLLLGVLLVYVVFIPINRADKTAKIRIERNYN
jgi:acyl-CoA synthetase (AMP-forming)/AMP-acid ligase II